MLKSKKNKKSETVTEPIIAESINLELDKLKAEMDDKISTLTSEYEEKIEALFYNHKLNEFSLENTDKLSDTVVKMVQSSVEDLTNEIFSLASSSRESSKRTKNVMHSITTGETSLNNIIIQLTKNINDISITTRRVNEVNNEFADESQTLTETLKGVSDYTQNISDLADQTNVLAINASIEAARNGVQGKGFAVIAGEVRKLANNSKDFATNIMQMIDNVHRTIDDSVRSHNSKVSESCRQLAQTETEIDGIINALSPQVELLTKTVRESSEDTDNITDRLDAFTVTIQFMDVVRQIIEHVNSINREVWSNSRESYLSENIDLDLKELREKATEIAKKYLTSKEEWDALGIIIKEDGFTNPNSSKQLKGNVVLF